jgi:ribosomal-protein-alanine N-acetyltransferase
MNLRRMKETDLDTVIAFEKQIFPDPWSRSSFEYEIRSNPFSIPLILEKNGEMYGYAIIWRIYEEFHIANIAIHPEKQGQKLGKQFLESIFRLKGDCAFAILEVRESNTRAIHLYEKFGFKVIMKRSRYYKNGETALVMQKIFSQEESDHHTETKTG